MACIGAVVDGTPIPPGWKAGDGGDGGDGGGGGGGSDGAPGSASSTTSLGALQSLLLATKEAVVTAKDAGTVRSRLAHSPVKVAVVCTGPCCDIACGLGLVGDRWKCTRTAPRKPRVRFAESSTGDDETEGDGGVTVAKEVRTKVSSLSTSHVI